LGDLRDSKIFNWTKQQIEFVLRTKTALGDFNSLFDDGASILEARLKIVCDGNIDEVTLKNKYLLPFEGLPEKAFLSIDDFEKFASGPSVKDEDKRRKVLGKILKHQAILPTGEKVCAYFVPSRENWDAENLRTQLAVEDQGSTQLQFRPGITVAVKGMPTGINITEPQRSGNAGYWQNLFVVVGYPKLKFDIGRKSLYGRQVEAVHKIIRAIFSDLVEVHLNWGREVTSNRIGGWVDAREFVQSAASIPDTIVESSGKVLMCKDPSQQEAAVAAIFYQLIGQGKLPEIEPITTGYTGQYDLLAHVKGALHPQIIEFKSKLGNISQDFDSLRKEVGHIDLIVCWNVTDEDKKQLKKLYASVYDKEEDTINIKTFPWATHEISIAGSKPVSVVDLKRIL
jgi:hypothetical protein